MCYLCVAASAAAAVAAKPMSAAASAQKPAFIVASFVRPVLFEIGPFAVYNYGLFIALGLMAALSVWDQNVIKSGHKIEIMWPFTLWMAGFGAGSKGHLAIQDALNGIPLTWKHFDIRNGHSFLGSQIGAFISMLAYIAVKRISLLDWTDGLLPCCLLGHTLGKFGCFFSGDGCYGPVADPANVPWAMSFPNGGDPTEDPVHPTPLYEAACSFAIFAVVSYLWQLPQPKWKEGRRTSATLMMYGVSRVFMERFRRHDPVAEFGGLTEYQAIAALFVLSGLFIELLIWRRYTTALSGKPGKEKIAAGNSKKAGVGTAAKSKTKKHQ